VKGKEWTVVTHGNLRGPGAQKKREHGRPTPHDSPERRTVNQRGDRLALLGSVRKEGEKRTAFPWEKQDRLPRDKRRWRGGVKILLNLGITVKRRLLSSGKRFPAHERK